MCEKSVNKTNNRYARIHYIIDLSTRNLHDADGQLRSRLYLRNYDVCVHDIFVLNFLIYINI